MKNAEWNLTSTSDNATLTLTRPADEAKKHCITQLEASFSAAAIKLLTIKEGTTVRRSIYVHNAIAVRFDPPLEFAQGSAISLELAASGSGGVIGAANLTGFTV